jgi:2-polyprenyl-3-methyl-5-hydroxy-6-metoxy-1,4-benzoquinol methylase
MPITRLKMRRAMLDRPSEISLPDFLRYFAHTPAALAIKECARLTELRKYDCPSPILDVGCGDGLFASIAFSGAEVWGIDIDAKEGRWAAASQAYSQVVLGDVTRAQLPESFFATCVANCSLEHVPAIDQALKTILRALRPGGTAFLFVPNKDWAKYMLSVRTLSRLGLKTLADATEDAINHLFNHHHLYDETGWTSLVAASGLEVLETRPVLSTATTVAFEAMLLPSLLGWANKHMTTRWTNFPGARKVLGYPAFAAVSSLLSASNSEKTAEFLVVARRPVEASK